MRRRAAQASGTARSATGKSCAGTRKDLGRGARPARLAGAGCWALLAGLVVLEPHVSRAQYPTSPPPAAPLKPMQFPPFREARLANGLKLIVVENHELPVVSLTLALPAGARVEPAGREGLAGLVATLLTKGTPTRTADQIAAAIEGVGGSLEASAGDDFFTVSLTVLRDYLDRGLDLLADVVLHPAFPDHELELARQRTLSALALEKSQPEALASRFFARALYGEHPYGRSATEASVKAITRAEVQQFAADRLKPQGALAVIAGDLTLEEARRLLGQYLGSWRGEPPPESPAPPPPPGGPTRIILVHRPGSAQSNIEVGNLALKPADPWYFPAVVGNKVLGGGADSRLFAILREQKGWTYGASSGISRGRDVGHFSAGTEVRTAVTDSALVELLAQLRRMRAEPVPDSELAAAKGFLVGSFPLSIETAAQVASQVSTARLLGLPDDYLRTYRDRLAAVTAADVLAAAKRVIRPDSAVIVVVGDGSAIYPKLQTLAPVEVIDADGKPVSPDELTAKAQPVAFDAAQLVARRDSFQLSLQGNVLGYMTAELVRGGDSLVYLEETAIAPVGFRQRTVVRMDPSSLATRAVDQSGSGGGQELEIHLVYAGGRVKGRAETPDPRAGAPKVVEVDTALAEGTLDINAFQPLVAALPLAEGATFTIGAFEASQNAVRTLSVKVAGGGEVAVPAGQFAVFRVEVTGGSQPLVFYLTREPPRRLVKLEIVGQPVVFEAVR